MSLPVIAVGLVGVLAGCLPADVQHGAVSDPGATSTGRSSPPSARRSVGGSPSAYAGWRPAVGQAWQWQLSGTLDTSVDVPVYDVDGLDTSAETVAELHRQGRRVICYLSVGTWEAFREDAKRFPDSVLGKPLEDWPDERWLDVRQIDLLAPLVDARLDDCRAKGFDAVEPDNVDGYANSSGFPLTADDQLRYNRWIAQAVHRRGMAVGLKNDLDQVGDLVGDFDFAVNEQCVQYDECDALQPFVAAGKAVLHVEYELPPAEFCAQTTRLGFSSMRKRYNLGAWRQACGG